LSSREPFHLDLTRQHHPPSDRSRRLTGLFRRQLSVFDCRNLNVQINAIEERAGDAAYVFLDLHRRAGTLLVWISIVAAGTGLHCPSDRMVVRAGHFAISR
jgi:hypothetical protein